MSTIEVKVPDIGDFKDVPVIEVLVKVGDTVKPEDALVTLESDKATMDVPAPTAGTVTDVKVKVGDKVGEGSLIVLLKSSATAEAAPAAAPKTSVAAPPAPTSSPGGLAEVRVPDIGDFKDVPVIEVMVKPGDAVKAEDPLVTLESDKATLDVPAPLSGVVRSVAVKVGDRLSEGSLVLTLATDGAAPSPQPSAASGTASGQSAPAASSAPSPQPAPASAPSPQPSPAGGRGSMVVDEAAFRLAYAGPGVRKIARELGVDLSTVTGSGDKGRILREDVEAAARGGGAAARAATAPAGAGVGVELLPWPKVDFAKFGPVESKPLSRIKKISAANLHRNWVMIPHVTNHDDADITELEAFRVQLNKENEKSGVRVSMLAFMIKAAVATLQKFPEFNASLDGDSLVLKKYWHIGFAADTPQGLVVPVIRDADRKGVVAIAQEMGELAALAREGKLKPDQMQGGTFTISSLGGIGGTYFTPIINAPEVAIMGVCRSFWRQVSPDGRTSAWRFILPLSLSWDHRVIDGASAARFNNHFAGLLADMRRVVL
ncbi:MAG: dihydrolipoyllysine-residue acetyltransferase [Betaproteobacteria bacterium]|nr:dihydrolipoyllysine-residue acetyltransferase [Betaproteobacteria bacterium]